jgi:hypothetical protein
MVDPCVNCFNMECLFLKLNRNVTSHCFGWCLVSRVVRYTLVEAHKLLLSIRFGPIKTVGQVFKASIGFSS